MKSWIPSVSTPVLGVEPELTDHFRAPCLASSVMQLAGSSASSIARRGALYGRRCAKSFGEPRCAKAAPKTTLSPFSEPLVLCSEHVKGMRQHRLGLLFSLLFDNCHE